MPVACRQIDGKWRLVESDGSIGTNAKDTAIDGGGHDSQGDCMSQARAVNANTAIQSAFSYVYLGDKDLPWSCSDAKERIYRKEVIYTGKFLLQDDKGRRFESNVDAAMLDHWAATFQEMDRNGVKVPVPNKHTRDTDAKRGDVIALKKEVNDKNKQALFAYVRFNDEEAERVGKNSDVSIWVDPELKDGKGKVYTRPITHIALTNYPVIPGLGEFQAMAASRTPIDEGKKPMGMRSLAGALGVEVGKDDSDDKMEAAISAAFKSAGGATEKLQAEIKALKGKAKETAEKEKPQKIAASLVNAITDGRKAKLDKLVEDRKILPAVYKGLVEQFCSEDAISLSLQPDAIDDGFDATVAALSNNSPVIELDEKTSGQGIALHVLNPEKNPVLADAEKRAKAAQG